MFGYDNVRLDSHVERRINESEAVVVRRIFGLCADGHGYSRIAKLLNAERAPAPRPQQGRPSGWSPSTVHEILKRPIYRGELIWNRTRKRDRWGQHDQQPRRPDEWLRLDAPHLRIVSDDVWCAAHERLTGIRRQLERATGRPIGGAHGARDGAGTSRRTSCPGLRGAPSAAADSA